ncbi:MAG: Grx4 family monothiol glutaredoxin [Candidatus Margulisbacteria bacterium]|jgi:monothiol glutaredoxin|nr:Grx4 family monothiol glutaredoxin [Candidatus Margulisiibacteriota bacterium]
MSHSPAIQEKMDTIKNDITNHKIMLYMKGSKTMPMCGFSGQVVQILTTVGAPFETKNVLEDDILRDAIKKYSDWPTIPQLYVNGEFIGGCDIITELYQSGELAQLLA